MRGFDPKATADALGGFSFPCDPPPPLHCFPGFHFVKCYTAHPHRFVHLGFCWYSNGPDETQLLSPLAVAQVCKITDLGTLAGGSSEVTA